MATVDLALGFTQSLTQFLLKQKLKDRLKSEKELEQISKDQSEQLQALATAEALVRATGLTPGSERASDILLDQKALSGDADAGKMTLVPGMSDAEQDKFFRETVNDAALAMASGLTPQQMIDLFSVKIKDFQFQQSTQYQQLKREFGGNVDLAVSEYESATSALGAIATAKRNRAKQIFDSVGGKLSKLTFPGLMNFVDLIDDPQLGRVAIKQYDSNRTVQAIAEFEGNVDRVSNNPNFAADPESRRKLRENGIKKLIGIGMKIESATKYVDESLKIRFASDKTWQEARTMAQGNYFSLYKRQTTGVNQLLLAHYRQQRSQFATKEEIKKHPPQTSFTASPFSVDLNKMKRQWNAYVDWAFENLDNNGNLDPLAAVKAIDRETQAIHQILSELALKDSGAIKSDNLLGIDDKTLGAALSGFLLGPRVAGP